MSVSFLDMNTNHNNQGINQLLMMNGNNNSGNQQQQPPPPPPGQQQMFNQTPQMQYLQGPQPGPQVRNSSVSPPPPPPPQQQMGQPQMQQQQRFNMNMPQQMSQQQMMAAQQQLQQQQQQQQQAAMAAASGRAMPSKNAAFNGAPTNGQSVQLSGTNGVATNSNGGNNNNNNSKTVSYNPNGLMSSLPSANLQSQSASTSRVHTPHMGNQPQPFIPQQMQPQQIQPQQGPNQQHSGPPAPNQQQMLKKGNAGNTSVAATPKNGTIGSALGPASLQQYPSFAQSSGQLFGMPPNTANNNQPLQTQFGPQTQQQQQQQGQHPTISGRSPILRQTLPANGSQEVNNAISEQFQQEINTRIIKRNLENAAIIRILDLIDFISNQLYENLSNIDFWTRITPANFLPSAILKFNFLGNGSSGTSLHEVTGLNLNFLQLNADSNNPNSPHQFELNTSTAPRFFVSCVQAKTIIRCSITLSGSKFQVLNNGSIIIVSKIELHFNYQDGSNSVSRGTVKILMSRDLRIEWIDLNCADYQGNISMSALETKLKAIIDSKKDFKKQKESLDEMISTSHAVRLGATSGIDAQSMRILQLGDIMTSMKSLMEFSVVNHVSSPLRSLELLITSQAAQQAQALQAQMAAQAHFQAANASGANSFIGSQQLQAKKNLASAANNNGNNTVSSPSPRTINAEDPKKKRKPSMSSLGDGKRRK